MSTDLILESLADGGVAQEVIKLIAESYEKVRRKLDEVLSNLEADIDDEGLKSAVRHLLGRGKLIRGMVTYLTGSALGIDEEVLLLLASSCELYHTASLIHDDIIDGGVTRRGVEAVHRKYGLGRAVLAGDVLILYPYYTLSKLVDGRVISIVSKAGLKMCNGESMELSYINKGSVNLEVYSKIAYKKTAVFFETIMEALVALSNRNDLSSELLEIGKHIGLAFQYRDDLLNFLSNPEITGKSCEVDNGINIVDVLMKERGLDINSAINEVNKLIEEHSNRAATLIKCLPLNQLHRDALICLVSVLSKRLF